MSKPERTMAATDLRVHLGAALLTLDEGDIIIERAGVPIARLSSYRGRARGDKDEAYERALSRRAQPGGRARMRAAMAKGWAGIDADELIANVYRWREEGMTDRYYTLDEPSGVRYGEVPARDVSAGQRRVHPGARKTGPAARSSRKPARRSRD